MTIKDPRPPPIELGFRLARQDDDSYNDGDENPMNIGENGLSEIIIANDDVFWVWIRDEVRWIREGHND